MWLNEADRSAIEYKRNCETIQLWYEDSSYKLYEHSYFKRHVCLQTVNLSFCYQLRSDRSIQYYNRQPANYIEFTLGWYIYNSFNRLV